MGKKHNYELLIKESIEELDSLVKKQQVSHLRDYVRFLLHLKKGEAQTQIQAGQMIGLGDRQSQNIWYRYVKEGLKSLLTERKPSGAPCKLGKAALEDLEQELAKDEIQFLHEAVAYIATKHETIYTEQGVHFLFKRLKIKKKTGRPSNIRQDKEQLEAFKKTLRT